MRKITNFLCLTMIACVLFVSCDFSENKESGLDDFLDYYMEKPNDWNHDFWIGDSVAGKDLSSYRFRIIGIRFFDNSIFKNDNEYIEYYITTCKYENIVFKYISKIIITDPNVTLHGLSIVSKLDEWHEFFESIKYTISIDDDNDAWIISGKYGTFEITVEHYSDMELKGKITISHVLLNVHNEDFYH